MADYAHPEVLVTTAWTEEHLDDPNVRILEVDYDPSSAYALGHIPNSSLIDWKRDINDTVRRDILSREQFEQLMARVGATPETTLVLYGDMRNWFAAFAFWTFKIYGHADVRLINGGRRKWIDEGRPTNEDVPSFEPAQYTAKDAERSLRSFLPDVRQVLGRDDFSLVDVRSPAEYKGEISAPPEYATEGAQRTGHIPGAVNVPWAQAIQDDDTFKPIDQLQQLYGGVGVTPDRSVITYCRIGERSSHTWFVLTYLLGYPVVSNYDGSWSEWGNAVGVPVEKETVAA
ncbi:MAG: sulfurtransferase [Candidatus Dormibacteraeota bacterium]|nr:sulfurtransferase [Candidatus Dormibacteraeota bacterium]MBV8445599.1 sulfurtransferase [Candidatus Dormibacteraeota bacterium]